MTDIAALGLSIKGIDEMERLANAVERLESHGISAKKTLSGLERQSKKTSDATSALAEAAKKAVTAYAGFKGLNAVKNFADTWSDLQSRVGAATGNMAGAANQMQRLVDIANASYSSLEQTVSAYAGNVGALKDLGKSAGEAADYTEALNHMLVLTATRGERAASVQNALSKAMAVGKLQADGLETVLANGGEVAAALAKELDTTVSGLRGLASEGKITGAVIANAIIKPLDEVRERAAEMPATVGDAMTRVTTNFTEFVGVLDKTSGASAAAASGIIELADGMRSLSTNKEALDTIIIAGETLAVVLGARLVTAGLASAGSFAAMQIAAMRATGAVSALAVAGRAASGALALVGGPIGLIVTAVGVGALAWSHYGKSARDNADAGVLGLVDAKKSVEELVAEFNKLNVLQQKQTIAIKQEELAKATKKAEEAVHDLSEAYKPFTGKGMNAVRQFNIAFQQETAALVANTEMTEAEMAQAFNDLIDGYIASGKAYADQRPKLEDMASAAVRAANDVRKLKEELFAIDVMGPPTSAMSAPSAARPKATTGGSGKEDPGVTLIKQMQERIALIGKESEYEQLLAKIRVGSIKFSTEAQKQSALAYAQTIDLLEAQAKAAEDAQKGFESNADAIANMEQELRLAALSGKDLAQAQALLSLNEYATDEQIAKVQKLAAALYDAQETSKRKSEFGTGKKADKFILGDVDPLSGGAFDDQFARYEAEAERERERYQEQQDRLIEARELGIQTNKSYDELEEQAARMHAARMGQIEQARYSLMLTTAADGFGALADIIGNAQGQQSSAYRAMFAVSKAFAVADATMKAYQAISSAWASAPFPANLAAVAMTTPQVLGVVSAIQGASLKGMAHDGIDSIPEEGTWLLNKGERVTTANTSAKLDATLGRIDRQTQNGGSLGGGSKVTVNVIEDAERAGTTERSTGLDEEEVISIFVANIRGGGEAADALESTYQLGRAGR